MVLHYIGDLYYYLTGNHERLHQRRMGRAGVPTQGELDLYGRLARDQRLRHEKENGKPIGPGVPSFLEIACGSRESYYNILKLQKESERSS